MSIEHCRLIELPRFTDERGSLTFLESERHIPFRLERVYYFYDVPSGLERGGHAHKALEQLFVALSGSFRITLDDGRKTCTYTLSSPSTGLYVGPMIWRTLSDFSGGAVCCVFASLPFSEEDYIRDYSTFLAAAGEVK